MSHQGWKNYETWCVALWIDNDEGAYQCAVEVAGGAQELKELADYLQGWVEGYAPEIDPGLHADLLTGALSEVDWREIAEHYVEEVKEDTGGGNDE